MNANTIDFAGESVAFEPIVPLEPLTAACVALIVLLTLLLFIERRRATRPALWPVILFFRILAIAGIWLALANPTATRVVRKSSSRHSAAVLDASASMRLADRTNAAGNSVRWQRALAGAATSASSLDDALALLSGANANLSLATATLDPQETRDLRARALAALREARARLGAGPQVEPLAAQLDAEVLEPLAHFDELGARDTTPIAALVARLVELREELRRIAAARAIAEPAPSTATPRIALTRQWLGRSETDWLRQLARQTTLARAHFADAVAPLAGEWSAVEPADPADASTGTDVQAALDDLARRAAEARLDFAVLITDGAHNAPNRPVTLPDALARVPLVVVPIGDYETLRDLDLRWKQWPKTISLNDELAVQARVSAALCDGESSVLELLRGREVLASTELRFEGRTAERLAELKWKPEAAGVFELTLRVRPLAREASLANNEAPLKVEVTKLQEDILMADAEPRWETRYLFNLLRREARSRVATVLFEPVHAWPGREKPLRPALPFSTEQWQRFQVVILGDLTPAQLTVEHQNALREFVEKGGALVLIAGANAMPAAFARQPLAELLPVFEAAPPEAPRGFGVRLTAEGRVSEALRISGGTAEEDAALWKSVYEQMPIHALARWSRPKPSARVLLEAVPHGGGEARAFLATHSFGRGSVTFLAAPATYFLRWRHGDRYHYQFWGQFLRALTANRFGSGTPQVQLQTDHFNYRADDTVQARLRLRAENGEPLTGLHPQIVAVQGERTAATVEAQPDPAAPGEYVASVAGLAPGSYELRLQDAAIEARLQRLKALAPVVRISIDPPAPRPEMTPPRGTPPSFDILSRAPTVMVLPPASVPLAVEQFRFPRHTREVASRQTLWDRWALLSAIAACLALEWIGRKIAGLI